MTSRIQIKMILFKGLIDLQDSKIKTLVFKKSKKMMVTMKLIMENQGQKNQVEYLLNRRVKNREKSEQL